MVFFIRYSLFLLFFVFFISAHATTIQGYEPDYAGREITFYIYNDPISKLEIELFSLKVDSKGFFSGEVEIGKTTYCFSHIDVYEGMLILEPNKKIKIVLPPIQKKTFAEEKNPYFKPMPVWIKVESEEKRELNGIIASFELRYNQLTDQFFNQLYFRQSLAYLDSVKNSLKNEFKGINNLFFEKQMEYKLLILEAEVLRTNQEKILSGRGATIFDISVPSCIDLIDRIYSNKLVYEVQSVKGADLQSAVSRGDFTFVKKYFEDKYGLKPVLSDIVLLKIFHDAFYSGKFSKASILKFVDSSFFQNNPNNEIRSYAKSVKQKLVYLMEGTIASVICLENKSGQKKCSDQTDKYTYLLFADLEISVNREHIKYLTAIDEKYKNNLQIFIVLENDFTEVVTKFLSEAKIPGVIVSDKDGKYSNEYRIKAYPTCYLLGKKQEIILSPAKPPLDGFEHQFAGILKETYLNQKRSQQ